MYDEAKIFELKLEKELEIKTFITSLSHVDNYKTILKSAGILMKMMSNAQSLGVDIEDELMDTINKQHQRLISERDLRNEIAIIDVPSASHESVKVLNDRIKDASEKSVEDEYL